MTDIVREAEELVAGVTTDDWICEEHHLIRSLLQRLRETEEVQIPQKLEPVLARIFVITDLGATVYHEVVYHDGSKWRSYHGSRTFDDGEQVKKWKYVSDCWAMCRARRAEIAGLKEAVKGKTFYHSDEAANEEMNRLRAERDELKEALEAVKWSGSYGQCPYCGADPGPRGHEASCRLGKALTRAGEE